MDFDVPTIELDPKKIKSYFHKKMENQTTDTLMPDFLGFAT